MDIHHYQPTMHHGKVMTVDGAVALVGANELDARSLAINEPLGMVTPPMVASDT